MAGQCPGNETGAAALDKESLWRLTVLQETAEKWIPVALMCEWFYQCRVNVCSEFTTIYICFHTVSILFRTWISELVPASFRSQRTLSLFSGPSTAP